MNLEPREQRILGLYESIGLLSSTMAVAAGRADWESLAAAERICGLLIERIEAYGDAEAQLGPHGRRQRMQILRQMLDSDAKVRRYTEPSLHRVVQLIASPPARAHAD